MDLQTLDLLNLQTGIMRNDLTVQGLSAALGEQLRKIAGEIRQALVYGRLEELPEEVLDILAWQFSVDWYDAESDVDTKRKAISEALIVSKIRGTPAAVRRVIEVYFGDGDVQEWFSYGGTPGYFRVITNNADATAAKAALLAKSVNAVKRLGSRLETVILQSVENMDLVTGFVVHTGDQLTLEVTP